jgi:hypothetical protein
MLRQAREEWHAAGLAGAPPPLPARLAARLLAHAHALRDAVEALPTRGVLSPDIWREEIASLVEDVASTVIGPQRVEAFLEWAASRSK